MHYFRVQVETTAFAAYELVISGDTGGVEGVADTPKQHDGNTGQTPKLHDGNTSYIINNMMATLVTLLNMTGTRVTP